MSTVEDPVWDRRAARCVIDLVPMCDKIIALCEKLRAAPVMVSPDFGEDDGYVRGVTILTNLRTAWQAEWRGSMRWIGRIARRAKRWI